MQAREEGGNWMLSSEYIDDEIVFYPVVSITHFGPADALCY